MSRLARLNFAAFSADSCRALAASSVCAATSSIARAALRGDIGDEQKRKGRENTEWNVDTVDKRDREVLGEDIYIYMKKIYRTGKNGME